MIKRTKPISNSDIGYHKCQNSDCENSIAHTDIDSYGHCHECVEAWVSYSEAKADND